MQGSFDTSQLSSYSIPVPVIQKGDLLGIMVFSDNPKATALYNQSISVASMATVSSVGESSGLPAVTAPGYLVDEEGNIRFQGIGQLHVEGLNKAGLIMLLNSKLKDTLLTNPYYNIRFLNYKITIIGDVAKPAIYSIPAENVNILEAIGMAGDLNITARRDNIRIIREVDGKRTFGEIDLRRPDIFESPFYQLHQNDIIYIDFNKTKAASSDQITIRNISVITGIVTTLAVIYSIFRR
ncbi:MAG: polysaccharide biosynthesis/export family protein [Bacteroidota bacterium]